MKSRAKPKPPPSSARKLYLRPGHWAVLEAFLERRAAWIVVGLVLLATARIVATYSVFGYTFDEPAHIAAGMQWLEQHVYVYEPQHPPLTRIMTAVLPKLFGAHGAGLASMWDEGIAILSGQLGLDATLGLARAGVLPFLWIASAIIFLCARWIAGGAAAVFAVFLFTMTPGVLAHAGLATTDMGLTAMFLWAVYSAWRWAEEPSFRRAATFGLATGMAAAAKFSTLAFFPSVLAVGLLLWLVSRRPSAGEAISLVRQRLPSFGLAVATGAALIWAVYLFSFGRSDALSFAVPAPEFFNGIAEVRKHDALGHLTYLLGNVNTVGWPHFYLVALGVKMPIPFIVLGLAGLALLAWRGQAAARALLPIALTCGVLLYASCFTQIKIGTRHVLPVFGAFAMAGGAAFSWLLRALDRFRWTQRAAWLVPVWLLAGSLAAHPDYLAYFNAFAGDNPADILVDSDLDWGQDVKRLAKRLEQAGAQEVHFNQFVPGKLEKLYGFPRVRELDFNGPEPGWNAVQLTPLKLGLYGDVRIEYPPDYRFWPETRPGVERIGKSILLYYQPPIHSTN